MQETQNLTNAQKLAQLKAGCTFQIDGDTETFASIHRPLYTAVYLQPSHGDDVYQGCIEPSLCTAEALTLSNSMCRQLVTVSIPFTAITIL